MKIVVLEKDDQVIGQMVRVTKEEALRLITSLSQQLLTENVNSDREEFTTNDGKYFSVAVHGDINEDRGDCNKEILCEQYPKEWQHAIIHLNPTTGEIHSDGDYRVREWLQEKFKKL